MTNHFLLLKYQSYKQWFRRVVFTFSVKWFTILFFWIFIYILLNRILSSSLKLYSKLLHDSISLAIMFSSSFFVIVYWSYFSMIGMLNLRTKKHQPGAEGVLWIITAVKHSSLSHLSHAIDYQKAHVFLDVSVALRTTQLYIHKIQLQLNVESTYYHNIMVSSDIRVGPGMDYQM